ncbi:MAG: PDZ domain-containing protein, partial [Cyclobacteriaceae bacterium]|nr:PDZ domain-containing protein [Cyclobacteriaceae bacterium]
EVTMNDNRSFKAEVIGTDPDTDLAVLKVKESNLPFLAFVDSDEAKVGQWVLAVGNPFNLNSTVTAGIISAKGRNIGIVNREGATEQGNTAIESFIQTDAAINPGNSGGALVDLNGGLLGINTAIASPTGAYSGYGFAVPSDIVSKIVEDIIKYGVVQRGWLGVSVTSVNNDLAKQYDLNVIEGAYVSGFAEKSAAKDAGIKEGDVVTKLDNTAIKSSTALTEYIGRKRPGDKVEVTINRAGKELKYSVTLKGRDGKTTVVKPEERAGFAALGIELEEIDAKVLKQLDLDNGVRIKSLGNGKLARSTDIREGFIITKVNDTEIKSVKEFNEELKNKKPGDLVILSGTYDDFPREFNYAFRM